MTTHGSRELGMFCSSSIVTLVVVVSRLMSMSGVAAVTLIVSVVPATASLIDSGVLPPLTTCTVLFDVAVEAGDVRLHGVGADRQVQEVRLPLCVGHLGLVHRAGELDVDAGQPSAGRVLDRHVDAAGEDLRRRGRGERERDEQRREPHRALADLTSHANAPLLIVQRVSLRYEVSEPV